MGLLHDLVLEYSSASPADAAVLRSVASAMCSVDGSVAPEEHAAVRAIFETVPQLRENRDAPVPPQANRQKLLAQLEGIFDPRLRKQCFVIAVDIALSSDGANDAEDAFVEQLKRALRIDDKFARQTIEVFGAKYACARD